MGGRFCAAHLRFPSLLSALVFVVSFLFVCFVVSIDRLTADALMKVSKSRKIFDSSLCFLSSSFFYLSYSHFIFLLLCAVFLFPVVNECVAMPRGSLKIWRKKGKAKLSLHVVHGFLDFNLRVEV